MFNAFTLFRSLVIYGVCLPLAVFLGYLVASPDDTTNAGIVGVVLGVLLLPLLLKWHHPLLTLGWNLGALTFFLPGKPLIWLPLAFVSFGISALQYAMNKKQAFISVPTITMPIIFLTLVVLLTAELTGGIGLRVAGGGSYGGKRYLTIFAAVAGYFAFTAKHIPAEKALTYVRMYILSSLTAAFGNLATVISPSLYFIFWIFPADFAELSAMAVDESNFAGTAIRLGGVSVAGSTGFFALLALLGIRETFQPSKFWRMGLLVACCAATTMGGYRSALIFVILLFIIQFYFEGLFRSRLLPVLVVGMILAGACVLPFAKKLPLAVQRTISFLPVEIDTMTEMDAKGSVEWRLAMWERTYPEIPKYLFIGKGYGIDPADMAIMEGNMLRGVDRYEGAYLAGDYHSGPLSVIMPFGIWGVIAFLWFVKAGIQALYQNYLHGLPHLKTVNTFFLSYFVAKVIFFFLVFGSLYSDMMWFTGVLGLSVALNNGVGSPAVEPVPENQLNRLKLISLTR